MSTPKYKQFVEIMMDNHKADFEKFREVHDQYALFPDKNQDEFNKVGGKIMNLMRMYEDRLCGRSEKTGYAKFTEGLAEKFQNEMRKIFPKIDSVGLTPFTLKKIL
jgi:hypothetical protein